MAIESILFWVSVGLLGYTYLGYPALIWLWATLQPPPPRRRGTEPTVTLVIVAHNEAARIAGRLENLLSLDYPGDRVEIVLGSDGSTDGTADRGRAFDHAGVTVVGFETRRGKPAVLNDLVPKARGEIVIMADARQRFERGALRALTAAFEDPRVGAVSGELILTDIANATTVGKGVGFYWRYEKFIRANESRVDSTVGATGAIYAIRRELFAPIADDTMLDDVLIPLNVARRGYRVLFEPRARAYDRVSSTAREEFTRKVRTIAVRQRTVAPRSGAEPAVAPDGIAQGPSADYTPASRRCVRRQPRTGDRAVLSLDARRPDPLLHRCPRRLCAPEFPAAYLAAYRSLRHLPAGLDDGRRVRPPRRRTPARDLGPDILTRPRRHRSAFLGARSSHHGVTVTAVDAVRSLFVSSSSVTAPPLSATAER